MESDDSCRGGGGAALGGEDDDPESSEYSGRGRDCCPAQLFTSVLLGLLACVLVTGGVFLAFHRWDHTWLLVSAVGVLLMAIGTALHCCSSSQNERKGHRCKGGCGVSRSKPDTISSGHGGTMLTEQLLPLSNARSVSQLSLNMVPGYFPPLVYPTGGPYGLEQHSAVVQNISKLVQHHQQLHLQSPTSAQSDSKSFILLPLPVDANAANIQNIVAAVCQLDNNASGSNNDSQTTDVSSQATETSVMSRENNSNVSTTSSTALQPSTSSQPVLKHAEVQTCHDWTHPPNNERKSSSDASTATTCEPPPVCAIVDSSSSDSACQATETEVDRTTEVSISIALQTPPPCVENLQQPNSTGESSCDNTIDILLNDIPIAASSQNDIPLDLPTSSLHTVENYEEPPPNPTVVDHSNDEDIEVDVTQQTDGNEAISLQPDIDGNQDVSLLRDIEDNSANQDDGPSSSNELSVPSDVPSADIDFGPESLADTSSDLESDLFDRSSPPPSYDDVTQETPNNVSLNTFGLAYGTM